MSRILYYELEFLISKLNIQIALPVLHYRNSYYSYASTRSIWRHKWLRIFVASGSGTSTTPHPVSNFAARQLVADQDREYAEVAEQDRAQIPTHDELEPAVAVDSTLPAFSEPTRAH